MTPPRLVRDMVVGHTVYVAGVCIWVNTMLGVMTHWDTFSMLPYRHRYGAEP